MRPNASRRSLSGFALGHRATLILAVLSLLVTLLLAGCGSNDLAPNTPQRKKFVAAANAICEKQFTLTHHLGQRARTQLSEGNPALWEELTRTIRRGTNQLAGIRPAPFEEGDYNVAWAQLIEEQELNAALSEGFMAAALREDEFVKEWYRKRSAENNDRSDALARRLGMNACEMLN